MENFLDDRMMTFCKLKGKHRCEDIEEEEENVLIENKLNNIKRLCQNKGCEASTSKTRPNLKVFIEKYRDGDTKKTPSPLVQEKLKNVKLLQTKNDHNKNKGQLLLEAIERSGRMGTKEGVREDESDIPCDMRESDIFNIRNNFSIHVDKYCDSPMPKVKQKKMRDISNLDVPSKRSHARQKITFDDVDDLTNCDKDNEEKSNDVVNGQIVDVPSQVEQARFRKNLDSAASMVFHSRTGLPLTSSPAPVRRGKTCFDFDSSINSVSAIKRLVCSRCFLWLHI